MWLFVPAGFFSIVWDAERDLLAVRSRVRCDLDVLRSQYLPELSETIELKGRDYPYRAYTDRACLSAAMVAIVNDLTYSNFKKEVERVQGLSREKLYARVWSIMYQAERRLEAAEPGQRWTPPTNQPWPKRRPRARPRRVR